MMLEAIAKFISDMLDPVCQDKSAVIVGRYRGYLVRMVPLVSDSGRVEKWVPDLSESQKIDDDIASGKIADASKTSARAAMMAANCPVPAAAPAPPAPPVLPPTFNPVEIPGL